MTPLLCKMKQLGVIGGLGPATGCMFCVNVNNKVIAKTHLQPDIVMENVPMPQSVLQKLAHGEHPAEVLALLSKSVTRLNMVGSDIIAIPCNTVHIFIDQLRSISKVPILSIIEEAAKECQRMGSKKVAIIASTTSINGNLHAKELQKRNIDCMIPTQEQQEKISDIIVSIVTNKVTHQDKMDLISIMHEVKHRGADSIMLACTDLRTIISAADIDIPVMETTAVLENSAVEAILE
jgi:aspartate racemase